jgi:hypothetical protein
MAVHSSIGHGFRGMSMLDALFWWTGLGAWVLILFASVWTILMD